MLQVKQYYIISSIIRYVVVNEIGLIKRLLFFSFIYLFERERGDLKDH